MIVVTGGAGFIGSNLVHALNRRGHDRILVVDNLSNTAKYENLHGAQVSDYLDKEDFLREVLEDATWLRDVRAVLHQGASSSTTEPDGRYVMRNNFEYSKQLLARCAANETPLIYASSAAVYGGSKSFRVHPDDEGPLNVYGFSKWLFDRWMRDHLDDLTSQVVGLRYFNVYGPREAHKGAMASMVLQLDDQLRESGVARLFGPSHGYEAGEQRRDFVFVNDVVDLALWFLDHPQHTGVFNCGSGVSRAFNDLARQVLDFHGRGRLEYIDFPASLRGRYQGFTEADMSGVRELGYLNEPTSLENGVAAYLRWRHEGESS